MKIGFDYWQVLSHYPKFFVETIVGHMSRGNHVYIVSAVGHDREGTVEAEVRRIFEEQGFGGYKPWVKEVVFDHPSESPQLKLELCKKIGIKYFYDDRDDVVRLLAANGIVAMRVPRKDNSTYDLKGDIKAEKK